MIKCYKETVNELISEARIMLSNINEYENIGYTITEIDDGDFINIVININSIALNSGTVVNSSIDKHLHKFLNYIKFNEYMRGVNFKASSYNRNDKLIILYVCKYNGVDHNIF